jgi:geranylgeranyl diphosphate synthase type I
MIQENSTINTLSSMKLEFDALLDEEMERSVSQLEGYAPLLARMARFHLGWIEPDGKPTSPEVRAAVQGKRIRPYLAFLSGGLVGGTPESIAPVAAAIELLHNFTLIHDDIQDRSPNRRHRATVWRIWGDAQAINVGDALFATAHRTMLRTKSSAVSPETLLQLLDEFNRITVEIVRGQTMDLEFETSSDITADDYLAMISGKTAAIVRFAAWAGAVTGGASSDVAAHLADFGTALGLGFQVRDDVLGIWGARRETGKDQADDIRRRKKSLPILLLREKLGTTELATMSSIYEAENIGEEGVHKMLELLDHHQIEHLTNASVTRYHVEASKALASIPPTHDGPARSALEELIRQMDSRVS